ncbi:MAG TPA: S9 family peptidase [Blastocatellia bacterium]|nr:S9 family peptidase [Blastocatellia bacterium]
MKSKAINQLLLFGVLLSLAATAGAQTKRAMTFEDILSLRVASDARLSPDGRHVAFVVTQADMKTNFRNSDIWLVSTEAGEPRVITRSPKRDDQPRWSPDSRRLAFISDRDGKAQLYVISIEGGEAEKITDSPTAVQGFDWSPDSRRIAFISSDPLAEAREKEKKDGFDQIVVDADYQYARISVVEVGSVELRKPVVITTGSFHVSELAWSPDGRVIAFTARSTPKLADVATTEIYAVAPRAGSKQLRVTNNDRSESDICWSPDGAMISYLATSDKYPTIGPSRIHLLKTDSLTNQLSEGNSVSEFRMDAGRVLQPQFDGYITRQAWSRDGRFIYLTADARVGRHIYRLSADGAQLDRITKEDEAQTSFTLSEKTGRIAYLKEDPTSPNDVYTALISDSVKQLNLQPRRLTDLNPQVSQIALGRAEVVRWKSSKENREIEGILIYPIDYREGASVPLVTSIHGGPEGAYVLSFMASHGEFPHIYAARGYASFYPNFRGSSNYGAEFASANVGDLGGGDYEDVMSGIDYLVKRGVADPARLAVKGWSYGGYLAGWAIGHTDRFKAAAFGAGLSNAISYYSQADIQFSRETLHQGTPWRNPKNMLDRSPVMYLQNAKTPSLIFHGEKDERVPLPQSLETYMGLKKAGVATQLVIYPREPHGLREPKHQLDKMRRELEWIEKYVRSSQPEAGTR